MAYVEGDSFLETSTKLTDIACARKAKGQVMVEELRSAVNRFHVSVIA